MIAMKRYFYILFVGALLSLTSCVQEDIIVDDVYTPSANSGLQFVGAVEDFDKHNVATRAVGGVSDAHVSEMTMIIFKGDGNMLPAMDAEQNPLPSNHINIRRSNPTFLIEATRYKGTGIIASMEAGVTAKYYNNMATDLGSCRIYIVANAYHLIGERLEKGDIQTESQLLEALVNTDATLTMPKDSDGNPIGLPMIGTHGDDTFNLSYTATGNNSVATISMKKLYSKVEFAIQVKSNQVVVGQTPKFTLEDIEIYNIPSQIRMGHVNGDYVDVICEGNLKDSNIAQYYLYNSVNGTAKHLDLPSKTTAYHDTSVTTDEKIEFFFYMPEHKVTPNAITYPNNIDPDAKQYYKPAGVGQSRNGDGTTSAAKIATFVRIIGSYTDHNAQINKVSYDIYLGHNNYNDFTVKRNQRLCNYVTITGLTNHKDAYPDVEGNVSIDHRVTMTSKGYNLSMEREAILDAHFEVRPLDVELSPGGSMTVVIPKEYKTIIAMESDAAARATGANTNLYVSTANRKAVRKYFTTNLVSELWGTESGDLTLTLKHSGKLDDNGKPKTEVHRIWFYIDENPNVYDKLNKGPQTGESGYDVSTTLYRLAKVNFFYGNDGATADLSAEPSATINFQQWNLWRVWAKDANGNPVRYYDIEHEEEYLNNYASDLQYGQTQDGMPWGLEGIILSNSRKAAYIDANNGLLGAIIDAFGGSYDSWINSMIDQSGLAPFYDFYLERDTRPKNIGFRNYNGKTFNDEIITTLKKKYNDSADDYYKNEDIQVEGLTLTDSPKSAIAYCYHKNKRDNDGNVADAKWFLPSIDEIEDISMGAYDEFDKVFQNKPYWSCQPSVFNKVLRVERERLGGWLGTEVQNGTYMDDNPQRARATSVLFDPSNPKANEAGYVNISSEVSGTEGTWTLHFEWLGAFVKSKSGYAQNTGSDKTSYTNHPGNIPRTESCRIRAVYRSGTK